MSDRWRWRFLVIKNSQKSSKISASSTSGQEVALIKRWKYFADWELAASAFLSKPFVLSKRGPGCSSCWVHWRMQNMWWPASHKRCMNLRLSGVVSRSMSNSIAPLPKALEISTDLQRPACLLFVLMKLNKSCMLSATILSAMLRIKSSLKKSILMEEKRKKVHKKSRKKWRWDRTSKGRYSIYSEQRSWKKFQLYSFHLPKMLTRER